jgi:predicted N-formylglutamate amidohydrolase
MSKSVMMQDFQAFEIIPGNLDKGCILLGDHATNRLPAEYGSLGLSPDAFQRHIAYDIGIEPLTRALAARLGVPAVMSCFSRLLIDPNRGEDDPTLIMKISDGAIIPGNHPISDEEWIRRIALFHRHHQHALL